MDFPEPEPPTRATDEPFGTLKETLSKAVKRSSYEKLTLSARGVKGVSYVSIEYRGHKRTKLDFPIGDNEIRGIGFVFDTNGFIEEFE